MVVARIDTAAKRSAAIDQTDLDAAYRGAKTYIQKDDVGMTLSNMLRLRTRPDLDTKGDVR